MMPPSSDVVDVPPLQPIRLVLVPIQCFYCGHAVEEDIEVWRIYHLFGLFHCPVHRGAAKRDCEAYMRAEGILRLQDARDHPVLGPFLTALGQSIPVLRSSGAVDTDWCINLWDEHPIVRRSRTTGAWGVHLTNGSSERFMSFQDFRDPRVTRLLKEEVRDMLDSVLAVLADGVY